MSPRENRSISTKINSLLKNTREQHTVVGPLVKYLYDCGWSLDQLIFGRQEWTIPKTPSEQTKREKNQDYEGFPVDIAVFDASENKGDYRHLLFIIECKPPTEDAGLAQLESYYIGEPYAKLGIWANNPDPSANATFLYRRSDSSLLQKRRTISDFPRPGEAISPDSIRVTFTDLIQPSELQFRIIVEDLLDKIVIVDSNVTRREEQLDQLCNILLLKLDSDKEAKSNQNAPVFFQPLESSSRTKESILRRYQQFVELYPDTFTTEQDKTIRFTEETIAHCVDALCRFRLIDLGVSTVAVAFQVLRSEALKQGEGQYFTPQPVIEAGVRIMDIQWQDIIIDPACGTGGFLIESVMEMKRKNPSIEAVELSRWAQTHIYGIEKDAIGLKLTKAIMQIAGDGSAHCARGDSVRVHNWPRDFPHLASGNYRDGRFSIVITNPPFGKNLKVSASDVRLSRLDIAKLGTENYHDLEIGLIFLQRAHQLLRMGGHVGIVLPETYFFSPNYQFVFEWIKSRLKPKVVVNIPMEAFQGFCRAKTNFYVFEKIGEG